MRCSHTSLCNMNLLDLFGPDTLDNGEYVLYHITPLDRLNSIFRYGLVPPASGVEGQFRREEEDIKGLFFIEDLEFVPDYLEQFSEIHPGQLAVLEVRIPWDVGAVKDMSGIAAVIVTEAIQPWQIRQINTPVRT